MPSLSKGGAERVVSILASELVKQNREAVVVTHFRADKEYPVNNDVNVVCLSNLNEAEYRKKCVQHILLNWQECLEKRLYGKSRIIYFRFCGQHALEPTWH